MAQQSANVPLNSNYKDGDPLDMEYPTSEATNGTAKRKRKVYTAGRVRESVGSSSFSLVSHIIDSKTTFGKLFWLSLLIGGTVAFAINLTALVKRLVKGPVLESYKPEGTQFLWPDITVCNPANPLPFWKRGEAFNKTWNSLMNRSKAYELAINHKRTTPPLSHKLAMSSLNPRAANFSDVSSYFFHFEIGFSNSQDDEITPSDDPYTANFSRFYHARLVADRFQIPCMTVNIAGTDSFKAALNQSYDVDFMKLYIIMDFYSYTLFDIPDKNRILKIFVSSTDETVSRVDHEYAAPGTDVFLKISMKRTERLAGRSTCVEKSFQVQLYDVLLEKAHNFSGNFRDCMDYVQQEAIVKRCGCYDPSLPIFKFDQHPPLLCLNMTRFSEKEVADNYVCMKDTLPKQERKSLVSQRCQKYLSPACKRNVYSVTHDAVTWPIDVSPARANYLKMLGSSLPNSRNTLSKNFLRKNSVFLTIRRMSNMADVIKEEYSYNFSQFISDFGGIIGLWLSLSLLSVFELIEIMCMACGYAVFGRKKKDQSFSA